MPLWTRSHNLGQAEGGRGISTPTSDVVGLWEVPIFKTGINRVRNAVVGFEGRAAWRSLRPAVIVYRQTYPDRCLTVLAVPTLSPFSGRSDAWHESCEATATVFIPTVLAFYPAAEQTAPEPMLLPTRGTRLHNPHLPTSLGHYVR